MPLYEIEVTDTFGGEANYSWVRKYTCSAKSIRGAIQWLGNKYCSGWSVDWNDGETARYNLKGAAICCFVTLYETIP